MPPAQRRSRTVGSSKSNAIAIDVQDDSEAAVPVASTSKRTTRPARGSARTAAARTSKGNTTKPLVKASSKRTRQETSSDTGSSSSDAIYVASSARPPASKKVDKGKQRERSSPPVAATKSSQNKQTSKPKEAPVAVDIDSDSSVEHLPTPESLVTDDKSDDAAPAGVPKRLLKADRTPIPKPASKERKQDLPSPSRSNFLERYRNNEARQYSKNFKGKVRSSASTSIPLHDERFASEDEDAAYESEDRPSARKHLTKQSGHQKSTARKASSSTQQAGDSDEPEFLGHSQSEQPLEDTSDNDLPDLPVPQASSHGNGTSSKNHKAHLIELNKRRQSAEKKHRSQEKRKKRVVASPSPSPEPIQVMASRPVVANADRPSASRKRITTREIPSSGRPPKRSQPMFRPEENDSESGAETGSSADSKASGSSKDSDKHKDTNVNGIKKAKVASSSSSSSSSSASSVSSIDEDASEVEEDITLDYNPVIRDKLRPKDNSKAHRLDKLRQARAAKILKEQKRKKGIVESEEDEKDVSAKVEDISSDETDQNSSDDDGKNFIVEDDGDIDEDALERVETLMPIELSRHGKLTLEDHFHVFITSVVFRFFLPKSGHYRKKREYIFSQSQVQKALNGLINSSIASSIWNEDFRATLDEKPDLDMIPIAHSQGCQGCSLNDRIASKQAVLSGKAYDPQTFEEIKGAKDREKQYDLGRMCADKAYFHHQLRRKPFPIQKRGIGLNCSL